MADAAKEADEAGADGAKEGGNVKYAVPIGRESDATHFSQLWAAFSVANALLIGACMTALVAQFPSRSPPSSALCTAYGILWSGTMSCNMLAMVVSLTQLGGLLKQRTPETVSDFLTRPLIFLCIPFFGAKIRDLPGLSTVGGAILFVASFCCTTFVFYGAGTGIGITVWSFLLFFIATYMSVEAAFY